MLYRLGTSYFMAERYEEAIKPFKQVLERAKEGEFNPKTPFRWLAATYAMIGQEEQAKAYITKLLKIDPNYSIKNVVKRVAIFENKADSDRIITALRKAGLPEAPTLPLPDKPSIAVLPFTNMSGDPEQEYFADGITDDLITDLSKISGLFVISRNSAFKYKGQTVDIKKVSRELGVRHILEGSVRRAGNQVRINAQLIDATTDGHLWAERYDGKMDDIFALQDKITAKIVTALAVKLTESDKERVASKGTENIEAYDLFLKGLRHKIPWTKEDLVKAVSYFKKAVEVDPSYGRAYAELADIFYNAQFSWFGSEIGVTPLTHRYHAREYIKMALKNPTAHAHRIKAQMNLRLRLYEKAIEEAERAISMDPNEAAMSNNMAYILIFSGKPEKAIDYAKIAMRQDPRFIGLSLSYIGMAHFALGQYNEAVSFLERALKHIPNAADPNIFLTASYANLGRDIEAMTKLTTFIARIWGVVFMYRMHLYPFRNEEVIDDLAKGLIKAGWPEPHIYFKANIKNRLNGHEIRDLVFGQEISGLYQYGRAAFKRIWWTNISKQGKVVQQFGGASYDTIGEEESSARREAKMTYFGKAWIEGNMFCLQYQGYNDGVKIYTTMFKNPEGTPEKKDEYIYLDDNAVHPFSVSN
jgi:TolB-like protein/Tfp pilus assembly protein PilF